MKKAELLQVLNVLEAELPSLERIGLYAYAKNVRDKTVEDLGSDADEFTINGYDIPIYGAAWTPDMMLRQSKEQDANDIEFVKNLNLNTIRLEGKLATDYFWDLCDKEGILVLAGWCCCSHWEKWENGL